MKRPEEIKKGLDHCCACKPCLDQCPYGDKRDTKYSCETELLADALAYIQQLETQIPKWISVEERLPNRNEKVVVTDGVHTWDYGEFNGLAYSFAREGAANPHQWNWKGRTVRTVNWWMPKKTALPEPPKEG